MNATLGTGRWWSWGFGLAVGMACGAAMASDATAGRSPDWGVRFADPPADARILKIVHGWPDASAAQDAWIRQFRTQGFGGVVCNVASGQYLESDAEWQAFVRAVKAAEEAGLALWLYDERGYPSGNAGGLVLRDHPEWEASGLLIAETECGAGPMTLEIPPGRLVLARAFAPQEGAAAATRTIDLTRYLDGRRLSWEAPQGQWHVLAVTEDRLYEGTHAEMNLHAKLPYINLLMPEPTARFLEVTHQRYADHLGEDLGRHFVATFTDEPSLMSCFIRPMPYRVLPWSPNLSAAFRERRGYALDDSVLPSLVLDLGPRGAKHRHDFWLTVGELVSESYFGQIRDWCRRHNIPSGGHLLMEESIAAHVPLYGDFFRCLRKLDAPGMDCLTSLPGEVPWQVARLVASAAELEERTLVMSETSDHAQVYRPAGDTRARRVVTEAEIRGTCNRLMVAGVNRITSYYSFTDLDTPALCRLNEWVGRCGEGLTGGHQVTDVAVLYPAETLWTKFTPSRHWARDAAEAARLETLFRTASEGLFSATRDFTYVDAHALAEGRVEEGALVHGPLAWRVIVLPGVDTLPLRAWENVARLVREGGVAVALGARPENSEEEFPCDRMRRAAREIFGEVRDEPVITVNQRGGAGVFLPWGSEGLLPVVLDRVLMPDVRVSDHRSPVRATHRRLAGREVYFVINDSPNAWAGRLSFNAEGHAMRWSPASGEGVPMGTNEWWDVRFEPYDARFFTFERVRSARHPAITSRSLPRLAVTALAVGEPTLVRGEHVRGGLDVAKVSGDERDPVWRATAELTRGGVDTFLFAQFQFSRAGDLSGAECLVLDTWVSEGQRTPNQLLVILGEEGGGDFIAETGRSLAVAGRQRLFIPLNQFRHAGWSRDADGVLDLKRVANVRVGWGGYLGKEGEHVAFSVTSPRTGRFSEAGR